MIYIKEMNVYIYVYTCEHMHIPIYTYVIICILLMYSRCGVVRVYIGTNSTWKVDT